MSGLSEVKKLRDAIRRIAKRLGIQEQVTGVFLTENGEYANIKFLVPAEIFQSDDPEVEALRDQFQQITAEVGSIDMSDFEKEFG